MAPLHSNAEAIPKLSAGKLGQKRSYESAATERWGEAALGFSTSAMRLVCYFTPLEGSHQPFALRM
jgi:hypothetical protein